MVTLLTAFLFYSGILIFSKQAVNKGKAYKKDSEEIKEIRVIFEKIGGYQDDSCPNDRVDKNYFFHAYL